MRIYNKTLFRKELQKQIEELSHSGLFDLFPSPTHPIRVRVESIYVELMNFRLVSISDEKFILFYQTIKRIRNKVEIANNIKRLL